MGATLATSGVKSAAATFHRINHTTRRTPVMPTILFIRGLFCMNKFDRALPPKERNKG